MSHRTSITGWLCLGAALSLFMCAAIVAARFGWRLGHDDVDRYVTAAVCVVAAFFALVMLNVATTLWRRGDKGIAVLASLVWTLAVAWDVVGAVGFSAANRSETIAAARVEQTAYSDTRAEAASLERALGGLEQRLAWVPQHRPVESVAAEIARLEISPAYTASTQCTAPTTRRHRATCRDLAQLAAEKAAGVEARTLAEEIAGAQARLAKSRAESRSHDTGGATTDAQALTLASIATGTRAPSGDSVWWMTVALCVLMAGLLLTSGVVFDCAARLLGWSDGERAVATPVPVALPQSVRDRIIAVTATHYGEQRFQAAA